MVGRETSEKAEQFNALLRKAFLLETQELDAFLNQVEDPEMRKQLDFLVRTADASTVMQFKTGVAGDQIHTQISETDQLLPGEKVGRFRVEKVIAKGGMGLVYLGFDELLGRNVAIKTIRPDHAFKPATQKRFIREAQILSQINDSRICQIYDFIEQSDCEFIVLEYIEGKNLNNPDLKLSQTEILKLFVQLAEALENAHQQGIIHRDLKPDNLMVTQEPALKILDFGIARSSSNGTAIQTPKNQDDHQNKEQEAGLTVAGSIMGTLQYMSPEQVRGLNVTAASDMYSAGVILQELLTKDFAYELNDTNDLQHQVANAELQIPKKLDKPLQSIISDLTLLEAEKRLTAKELSQRLNHYIEKPQRIKRNSLLVTLFCLVVIAGWFWFSRFEEANKTQQFNDFLLEADAIGNQLNQVYTLPLHDISDELELSNGKTLWLTDQIDDNKDLDTDAKYYLKGMAFKKVHDMSNAIHFLEKSWNNGYRNHQIIHELAETAIYHWWYGEFNGFLTHKPTEEFKKYRQKALEYAQLSKDAGGKSNSIPAAFLLWRSKQYDSALSMIDTVLLKEDWHYNGYLLKAAIYTDKLVQFDSERTLEQSHEMNIDAINAYKLAAERARSHPLTYLGVCQMNKRVIRDALTNSGYAVEPFFEDGIHACEQALKVQPQNPYARAVLGSIYVTYAEVQLQKGHDIRPLLEKAQYWTEQDIAMFAKDSSYINKAEIHAKMAQYNNRTGINPEPQIKQAVEAYKMVGKLNPNTLSESTVGILYNLEILAQYKFVRGQDFSETFKEANSAFERFISFEEGHFDTFIVVAHMNTAALYYLYGKYLLLTNQSVDEVVNKGLAILAKHPDLFGKESFIYGIRAQLLTVLARQQIRQSLDAKVTIDSLNSNINQALTLFPTQNELLLIKANGLFLQQQNTELFETDAEEVTENNIRLSYQQAIEANPQFPQSYVDFAKYLKFLIKRSPKESVIDEAVDLCDKALQVNPNFAEAFAIKADLLEVLGGRNENVSQLREKAQNLNPLLVKTD